MLSRVSPDKEISMMIKKYRLPLFALLVITSMLGLLWRPTRIGHAQAENDWSQPVNISASGIASRPVAVVDFRGTIHAIWVDEVDGYKYSQSKDGITWSVPITVEFPFGPKDPSPILMADKNGAIHVFWINAFFELNYAQATSDGLSNPGVWVKTRLSRDASNFDVLADSSGKLHLVFIENITDGSQRAGVYYRQSIAGGGFWSEPALIYQSEYFRASTALNTYLRVAVSEQPNQKVFISWDNRPLKRSFIATSGDGGLTWSAAQQFKGPDDTGGYDSPFNISIWASSDKVLLMWQVGQPGASKCSVFSQWSEDNGQTWGDIITLFGGPTACPSSIRFVVFQNDKVAALLSGSGDPTLIAWNESQWSDPQAQIRLPALSNPETYDAILLGCRQDIILMDRLLVFGCDEARGGDIWFMSRPLIPLEDWFSPSSLWSEPIILEDKGQRISDIDSASDAEGNIHTIWVELPPARDSAKPFMQYSRWDGERWSNPETIIRNLDGQPLQLDMYLDAQGRLLLAWVDGARGDLLFSWANLPQAGLSSGWVESVVLPSPSQLNSAPSLAVDASGRIIVAFAVPYNENRGIYLVQSTDNGATWSPYIRAFDGAASQWDRVNSPKIAISSNGTLHLLVTRQAEQAFQQVGLYYLQSQDGGVTWSNPEIISEGTIYWSEVVAYGQNTIHRLWQENDGLVVANLSQESRNDGTDWGKVLDVTDVGESPSPVALVTDRGGHLHYIQLLRNQFPGIVNQDKLVLKTWVWDGSLWSAGGTRELTIKGSGTDYGVAAGLSANNYLGLVLSAGYTDVKGQPQNQVLAFGRFVESPGAQGASVLGTIPTPVFSSAQGAQTLPTSVPATAVDPNVLFDSNDPSEGLTKNLVGGALIALTALTAIFLFVIRRPKKRVAEETDE
jgi:hypothetical protein